MEAHLIAHTVFDSAKFKEVTGFAADGDTGSDLVEAAGRACYQSFSRPNPATATNAGYLRHILEVGHNSVLEHGSATLYFTGVSRSLTHELVRHRHFSYSQLSQRYVDGSAGDPVMPPDYADHPHAQDIVREAHLQAQHTYQALVEIGQDEGLPRKRARQAARAVLPNAQETRIVVTGNYRAWRHFIKMRATEHADVEIRALAVAVLRELQRVAPNVFADFGIGQQPDGSEVATWRGDADE